MNACKRPGCPVGDSAHPDPADAAAHFFGRDHNQRFRRRRSPLRAAAAHERLVDFHPSREPIATRPHHGAPQLVQPRPRRLIAAESQDLLQRQGAGAGLGAGDAPHRAKPIVSGVRVSWKMVPAVTDVCRPHAAHCQSTARTGQAFVPPAGGAAKSLGPAQPRQIRSTGRLGRKASLEFGLRPRIILHGAGRYMLGSPESSG